MFRRTDAWQRCPRSAGFLACCSADFPVGRVSICSRAPQVRKPVHPLSRLGESASTLLWVGEVSRSSSGNIRRPWLLRTGRCLSSREARTRGTGRVRKCVRGDLPPGRCVVLWRPREVPPHLASPRATARGGENPGTRPVCGRRFGIICAWLTPPASESSFLASLRLSVSALNPIRPRTQGVSPASTRKPAGASGTATARGLPRAFDVTPPRFWYQKRGGGEGNCPLRSSRTRSTYLAALSRRRVRAVLRLTRMRSAGLRRTGDLADWKVCSAKGVGKIPAKLAR